MASIATRDQIVSLGTSGISNHDTANQLHACSETVFKVWKRYTEIAKTSSKPACHWLKAFDLYQTNCASRYEASDVKSSQKHEEKSKSGRDFKFSCAQDILK